MLPRCFVPPNMNVQVDRNQPRTPATDSRALQNLIKSEKAYVDDLLGATSAAYAAASSLHAWGISETPDLDHASGIVSQALESAANAQKTYAQALDQYHASLRDMLDREQSIRSIVRDRDILMSRVIKMTQRKPTRWELMKGEEDHQARVIDAQNELQACEQTLANETTALVAVKRRTFKEALTMRAKVLGDTGARMMDSARDILVFLDTFDADYPVAPVPIQPYTMPYPPPPPPTVVGPADQHVFLSDASVFRHIMPQEAQPQPLIQPSAHDHALVYEQPQLPYEQAWTEPAADAVAPSPLPSMDHSSLMASPVPRSRSRTKRSSSLSRHLHAASLPTVPGGVPTAPRMNLDHARDGFVAPAVPGGVPTAPRLFVHDNDSDELSTADTSVVHRPQRHRRVASDDGHRRSHSSGGGFFSRVSNLFRTDMAGAPSSSDALLSPRKSSSRSGRSSAWHMREHRDSSDDEMPTNVTRHVNERVGASRATPRMPIRSREEQMLDDAIRQSVIGAGITARPSSRQSDSYGISKGPPPAHVMHQRKTRSSSVDLGAPGATRKVKKRVSSDRVSSTGSAASTHSVKTKKKRDPATGHAFPPPAPSSYFHPSKHATESWVTRPDQLAPGASSTPSSSRTATPLKSAIKTKKTPKKKHISISESQTDIPFKLELGRPVDGTGSLGMDTTPAAESLAPALSYLQVTAPSNQAASDTEASEIYRAFLSEGIPTSTKEAPAPAAEAPPPAAPLAPAPLVREETTPSPGPSTWNTRIGRRDADSSDEDDAALGGSDYYSARAAFGESTRHLGLATGAIQPSEEGVKKKATRT